MRIDEAVSDRFNRVWLPSLDLGKLRVPPTAGSDGGAPDGGELHAFAEKLGVALRAQIEAGTEKGLLSIVVQDIHTLRSHLYAGCKSCSSRPMRGTN